MKRFFVMLTTVLLLVGIGANGSLAAQKCKKFKAPKAPKGDVTLLTGQEIISKVLGNTVDAGKDFQMFYYPNGTVISIWSEASQYPGAKYGKWSLCG